MSARRDLADQIFVGHSVEELLTLGTTNASLRVFVCEPGPIRRVALACDNSGGLKHGVQRWADAYVSFDQNRLRSFASTVMTARTRLLDPPERSGAIGLYRRIADSVASVFRGRVVIRLGKVACDGQFRLRIAVTETLNGERHLALTFKMPLAWYVVTLDASGIDALVGALRRGDESLSRPLPGRPDPIA